MNHRHRGVLPCPLLAVLLGALCNSLPAAVPDAGVAVAFEPLVAGLTAPIHLEQPDDGSGRLFVAQQDGLVRVVGADGALHETPLLDPRARLLSLEQGFEERGLLGLAIHPRFADNGRLFVTYSAPLRAGAPAGWNHTRRVSEFTLGSEATRIDPDSERVLLELDWPSRKHNGGGLAFGPDGLLYIGFGDGGGVHGVGPKVLYDAFAVPAGNAHWDRLAQDVTTLFGKILRIDVDGGFPAYTVPASNPFAHRTGRGEIYAWGFRNPYRIAFDPAGTGQMVVTAIAETLWEAIYLVGQPGNYGWAVREGTHCFDRLRPQAPPPECPRRDALGYRMHDPIVEYGNLKIALTGGDATAALDTAVVGGQIYRGRSLPALQGRLVFADWSADFRKPSGQVFLADPPPRLGEAWRLSKLGDLPSRALSVARDLAGELYVLSGDEPGPYGSSGRVYRLVPRGGP